MKRILYFDASSGVSGDMFVGSLLDAGADIETIRGHINSLGLEGFGIRARKVNKGGLIGAKFDVIDKGTGRDVDAPEGNHHEHGHGSLSGHHHRGLRRICEIIGESGLPKGVAANAVAVFRLIAEAESRVHGTPPEEVHFHELGAVDCIVDIVSAASAYHQLDVDEAWCSPINVGSGSVRCAHGVLPAPAPATVEILRGIPIYSTEIKGELATPTGAALIRHFCKVFAPMPRMIVEKVGYGAGSKDFEIPNLLRAMIGRIDESAAPVQD